MQNAKYETSLVEKLHISFGNIEPESYTKKYVIRSNGFAESAISALTGGNYVCGYDEAVEMVDNFYSNCNDETGNTITIWMA